MLHTGYHFLTNIKFELHFLCLHAGSMAPFHCSWLFGKEAIAKSRMQCSGCDTPVLWVVTSVSEKLSLLNAGNHLPLPPCTVSRPKRLRPSSVTLTLPSALVRVLLSSLVWTTICVPPAVGKDSSFRRYLR